MEVDAEAEAEAEAEIAPFNDWETATRNADLKRRTRPVFKTGGKFDSLDWGNIPSADTMPGSLVRLTNAPGAMPAFSEDILPKSLFPSKKCPNPSQAAEVKAWAKLTQRIKRGKATIIKYTKWATAARAALKKIATQARTTKNNVKSLNQAIRGMKYQRKQLVKRLKSYKLKAQLDRAAQRMMEIQGISRQIGGYDRSAKAKKAGVASEKPAKKAAAKKAGAKKTGAKKTVAKKAAPAAKF